MPALKSQLAPPSTIKASHAIRRLNTQRRTARLARDAVSFKSLTFRRQQKSSYQPSLRDEPRKVGKSGLRNREGRGRLEEGKVALWQKENKTLGKHDRER